jgi:hypothetical protein
LQHFLQVISALPNFSCFCFFPHLLRRRYTIARRHTCISSFHPKKMQPSFNTRDGRECLTSACLWR